MGEECKRRMGAPVVPARGGDGELRSVLRHAKRSRLFRPGAVAYGIPAGRNRRRRSNINPGKVNGLGEYSQGPCYVKGVDERNTNGLDDCRLMIADFRLKTRCGNFLLCQSATDNRKLAMPAIVGDSLRPSCFQALTR